MVSRRSSLLAAIPLALSLASCVSSPDEVSDVISQRRKWAAQGITSYRVESRLSCFCITDATEPVILEVRDRKLVSVTRVSDGSAVPPSEWEGRYYTVDEMFVLIGVAQAQGADDLRVTYDPALGYPTEVYIDLSFRLADEERQFELTGLTPTR